MAWIDDVLPQTTIRSVWGNGVRDRTVHQFASKAERDAVASSKLVDGMACYTAAEQILWLRRGGAWWPLAIPPRNVACRMWFYSAMSLAWLPVTLTDIRVCTVERRTDWVHFQCWAAGNWNASGAALALGLPYPPLDTGGVPVVIGSGQIMDGAAARDRGGAAYLAGIVGTPPFWALSVTDMQTGLQAQASQGLGGMSVDVSYRTSQADDVAL